MGLFDKIFKKPQTEKIPDGFFELLTGYAPSFTNAPESLYEMELIRAAVHSFASFCSKLKPEIRGSAAKSLEDTLLYKPNPWMDTTKFLYRLATILSLNNTALIVPVEDAAGFTIGYFPVLPKYCEIMELRGKPYLRFSFSNGQRAMIEYEKVGILTQHQYANDIFGNDNKALRPTMQLIHTHNQGIINGVKNSAVIRFMARINNVFSPELIAAERKRFAEENLSAENQSGMILFDNKFADMKQIDSKPFTVNALQMEKINENVYNYFGTNAAIIQNKYSENEWNAYYEGKIEVFALQLSLVMSNMTFSPREIAHGNEILWTANRLQYASSQTKLNISTQLFDRGLLNRNGVMDIWDLPHVENGDQYFIRREYAKLEDLGKGVIDDADSGRPGIQGNEPAADVSAGGAHEEV